MVTDDDDEQQANSSDEDDSSSQGSPSVGMKSFSTMKLKLMFIKSIIANINLL